MERIGDSLSLDVLLLSNSKMVSSLRNRCFYLTETKFCMLNICEGTVEGKARGSLSSPSDKEEHGTEVLLELAGFHENEDSGCYDH